MEVRVTVTKKTRHACAGLVIALVFGIAANSFAQGLQTGIISGTITTDDGLSLPGATVTVTSPGLQGARTTVTDVNGNYVLRGLPPGDYTVTIELTGMTTRTERTVVALGRTTTVDAVLAVAGVSEAVTVVAEASPVLNNPVVGANFRKEEVDALPLGRTPQNIAELSPGLTDNTPNTNQLTISGGFAFDNVFLVDGVDINDNIFATPNNLFIEDAVEETQILTSGISAEYGRFSGGVVNLVTKRGGNRFSGTYRANLTNPKWVDETPFETTARRDDLQLIHEGTLGGPILQDRLWFFLAGRHEDTATPYNFVDTGFTGSAGVNEKRFDIKLTGTVANNHTFQGSFLNDDLKQTGVRGINASAVDPRVLTVREIPQKLGVVNWNGVLSSQLFATAQWSRKEYGFRGNGGTSTAIIDSPFRTRGGGGIPASRLYNAPYFDANDPEDRNNQQLTGSVSYFLSGPRAGSHDIKAGVERYTSTNIGGNSQTATGYVFWSNYVVDAAGLPRFNADGTLTPRFIPGNSQLFNWLPTRGAKIDITTSSVYLQDQWAATRRLTFDLGMRYERVRSEATGDIVGADTDTWVPRLAATYDVAGDGKWVGQATYAHYAGKYSEAQFAGNSDVGNPSLVIYGYTGPAGEGLNFAPGLNPANYTQVLLGSFPTANVFFEDGLSSALNKEFTASFGGEIGRNGFAKATYVRRKTNNIIDDFIQVSDGTTVVIRNGVNFGEYDNIVYRNAGDELFREYQAMVFQGRYRASTRWTLAGHWTLQLRNHGNFEGEAANQPGAPSLFGDYPEAFSPERNFPEGRLDDFQRHKVRLWTTYIVDMGRFGDLDLSALWRYNSGLTYSLRALGEDLSDTQLARAAAAGYVNEPNGGTQTIYFGERGSETFPGYGVADFGVGYNIPIWGTARPYVKFEVLNAFNNQKLIGFDTTLAANWNGPVDALGIPTTFSRGQRFGQANSNTSYPTWRTGQNGSRAFLMALGLRF
jgi:outer membrane receptor protein involved in Fe transport